MCNVLKVVVVFVVMMFVGLVWVDFVLSQVVIDLFFIVFLCVDVEVWNNGFEWIYVVVDLVEIVNFGKFDECCVVIFDFVVLGLLVMLQWMILEFGECKLICIVVIVLCIMKECIYCVMVKFVVGDVVVQIIVLKLLVGYDVLVMFRLIVFDGIVIGV